MKTQIKLLKVLFGVVLAIVAIGAVYFGQSDAAGVSCAGLFMLPLAMRSPDPGDGGGLTPEQKAQKDALIAEIKTLVTQMMPSFNYIPKSEFDNQLSERLSGLQFDQLKGEVVKLTGELNALKESPSLKGGQTKTLAQELDGHKAELTLMAKRAGTTEEIVVKALVDRSDIDGNQQAFDLPDIGQLATRKITLYQMFPKLRVGKGNHNGTIRYYDWDEATIARAAAAVAEGAAFPESTAKFKKYSVTIQKIGDTLPVTEEFFEDAEMFAAELEAFLNINVQLEIDRQLADGDGTGNQIVGLKASVDAFVPATYAGTVVAPTIYDLIVKVSEDITTTGGAKYIPNFAVMNIADINKMKLAKDANNNYIIPPFVDREGKNVAGIVVFESNIITANTMVVGDSRFARIYEMAGIVLSKGTVGTQFTEDEMTLKARKRLAFLIRNADKGGFKKVTDIDAAVAAIAIV